VADVATPPAEVAAPLARRVCASLRTITIALAAQHVVRGPWWFGLIYFTPSLLIAIGTYVLWKHDASCMAVRNCRDEKAAEAAKLARRRRAIYRRFGGHAAARAAGAAIVKVPTRIAWEWPG
jgi:hypothetical protein